MVEAKWHDVLLVVGVALLCAGVFSVAAPAIRAAPAEAPQAPVTARPIIGPYVNSVTDTSARIVWASAGAASPVSITAAGGDGRTNAKVATATFDIAGREAEKLHVATVTGLQPGAAYAYRIAAFGPGGEGTFQTAPAKGSKGPLRFVCYSDPQTYPQRHRQVVEAVMKELPLAFLAISGDFAEDASDWDNLKKDFFDPARDLLRQTALWTARGNHEKDGVLYRSVFVLPGNELYYSFDYGNLHYVMLDCYKAGSVRHKDAADMAEMIAWLEKDLGAAKGRAEWFIVSYHEPTINVGARGCDWGREDLLPVLEKHGVDLVLCGHSHIYERIRPVGPRGGKPTIHITHGGGGGPTYNIAPSPILETSYAGLHHCVFTIEGNRLEMVAKTPDGKVLDRMTLVKTAGMFQKEVMDRALATDEIGPLVKVFKIHRLHIDRLPVPGEPLIGTIPAGSFPVGYRVRIAAAADCPWKVEPLDFTSDGGQVVLKMMSPPEARMSCTPWMGAFSPELRLAITLTRGETTSSCESVSVQLPVEVLKAVVTPPAAEVAPVPAAGITVDGRLDDWAAVAGPVVLPSTGKPAESLKLAWDARGLYGALVVADPEIKVDAKEPWQGDAVEIDVEMDLARRLGVRRDSRAAMIYLTPQGDGRAGVDIRGGRLDKKAVEARWTRTAGGYAMEFRIDGAALAPAKLAAGGTIGFHYALRNGGKAVEEFVDTRRFQTASGKPVFWGRLTFADGRP